MCGIAGFANIFKSNFKVEDHLLLAMQEKIKHRGPDGFGIWKNENLGVGLAHRRLSLIDLSDAAKQPMENSRCVISFNGEIYNHLQIRKELEERGYKFFTNSDTEAIINAYSEWGIDCLNHLDGEFAFALYDKVKNETYLVRDRMGIKPMYFSIQNGILAFSSEIKAFDALPWIKKEASPESLYYYFTFMVTPAPLTIYKSIYKLPPSYYLKLDSTKKIIFKEWYSPIKNLSNIVYDENYYIEETRRLLNEAVEKRMMADVPIGVFLSGGIDSSLIVALMSKYTSKINTYTVAFSDAPKDERIWAQKVAKKFSTNHHEIVISENDAFNFFEKMVYHHDEPLADCVSIPLYYVSKKAHETGIKAVQIGEGSDELFFGYPFYSSYARFLNGYIYKYAKNASQTTKNKILKYSEKFLKNKTIYQELIFNWANNYPLFNSGAIAFDESHKLKFINRNKILKKTKINIDPILPTILGKTKIELKTSNIINYHLNKLGSQKLDADLGLQMAYLELKQRVPELLLMRADKMMMAASVEARVPFLDYKLVEFVLNIPLNIKFKNNETKYILKKACEGILPKEIIYRKKVGFGAPTSRWYSKGKKFPNYFNEKFISIKRNLRSDYINWEKIINKKSNTINVQKWTIQNLIDLK